MATIDTKPYSRSEIESFKARKKRKQDKKVIKKAKRVQKARTKK